MFKSGQLSRIKSQSIRSKVEMNVLLIFQRIYLQKDIHISISSFL